jgi:prepilin-type N-terminal cleavage/methylation domain-containing protein
MDLKTRKTDAESGFSLIEVIMVIVMIGLVSFPLMRLANTNLSNVTAYNRIEKAQSDMKSQMEQVLADYRALGYDALKTAWDNRTGSTNSGLYQYSVAFGADQVIQGITCSEVTVTLSGALLDHNMILKTMISK